jgi:hypothetical protein
MDTFYFDFTPEESNTKLTAGIFSSTAKVVFYYMKRSCQSCQSCFPAASSILTQLRIYGFIWGKHWFVCVIFVFISLDVVFIY